MKPTLRPLPSQTQSGNPIDIAAAMIRHPRAEEWRLYARLIRFPHDFKTWLAIKERQEFVKPKDKTKLAAIMNDPFCRSPIKKRRI